jgi:hypothetical protein
LRGEEKVAGATIAAIFGVKFEHYDELGRRLGGNDHRR